MVWLPFDYGINILLAVAAAAGFWGIGRVVRRALLRKIEDDSFSIVFDFAIGACLIWTAIFFLGLAGLYQPLPARLLFTAAAAVGLIQIIGARAALRAALNGLFEYKSLYERTLLALCAMAALLALAGALTPPAAQDALVHHLALPKTLIKAGRLIELPYDYFYYFPSGMEMLYLYAMLVRGATLATLIHYAFGIVVFAAILSGGRALGIGSRARLIAATAFFTAPTVWMEMTWAYIDLALVLYATLALTAMLRFRNEGETNLLALSGIALGGALSLKYTALIAAAVYPLLLLFILRERKQIDPSSIVRALAVPLSIAALVSSVWFIRNLIFTGNPLFPFFLNLIPSSNPGWDKERGSLVLQVLARYGGLDKTFIDYLLTPLKLSFLARYGEDAYYQGMIGPFYSLSILLPLLFRRIRKEAIYLFGFALVFYLFWLVSAQEMRYLLPALPALAMAAAMSDDLFSAAMLEGWKRWAHGIALSLVMAAFLFNCGAIVYYFDSFGYANLFLGRTTPVEYLRNKFDYYPFYEYINQYAPSDSKIMLINTSNQPFYLERRHFSDSVFEAHTITRITVESRSPEEIKERLKAMGITHLLYRPHILFGENTTPFTPEQSLLFRNFLQNHCAPLMTDEGQRLVLFSINP